MPDGNRRMAMALAIIGAVLRMTGLELTTADTDAVDTILAADQLGGVAAVL